MTPSPKYKILIITEEENGFEGLKRILQENESLDVISTSWEKKNFFIGQNIVDLILLDEKLEKLTPIENSFLYSTKRYYSIPVIYICRESTSPEIKQFGLSNYGYIVAPFKKDYVFNTIFLAIQKGGLEKKEKYINKLKTLVIFSGGIAHDFNNLLGAIIGYSELLKFKSKQEPELTRYVDLILKASNKAKNLVELLTNFSRNWDNLKKQRFPIHIILKETIRSLQANINSSKITIIEDITKEGDEIVADPTHIHLLCAYLFNALTTLLQEKGEIKVSLKKDNLLEKTDTLNEVICLSMEARSSEKIKKDVFENIIKEIDSHEISNIIELLNTIIDIDQLDEYTVKITLFLPEENQIRR